MQDALFSPPPPPLDVYHSLSLSLALALCLSILLQLWLASAAATFPQMCSAAHCTFRSNPVSLFFSSFSR